MSRSERSIASLPESSSGLLPAVQEGFEDRLEESIHTMEGMEGTPDSARTISRTSERSRSSDAMQHPVPEVLGSGSLEEVEDETPDQVEEKPLTWRIFTPEQSDPCRAPVFGQPVPQRVALPVHATAWSLTLPSSASHRKLAVGPTLSLSMEAKARAGGAQTVQLPRPEYVDGAMKRSLSQSQEGDEKQGGTGEREDRLVSTQNAVMYSARPPRVSAPPPCTFSRPSPVQQQPFRVVTGAHPSHGYRPMTVAFHGFQVATRPPLPAVSMSNPPAPSVRWV